MKLRQILRAAGGGDVRKTSLGYAEALMSFRCLAMGAFWTFDNLNYLTTTDTVGFGVARATRGFSRAWSVSSALYILLGVDSLRKVSLLWVSFSQQRVYHTVPLHWRETGRQGMGRENRHTVLRTGMPCRFAGGKWDGTKPCVGWDGWERKGTA